MLNKKDPFKVSVLSTAESPVEQKDSSKPVSPQNSFVPLKQARPFSDIKDEFEPNGFPAKNSNLQILRKRSQNCENSKLTQQNAVIRIMQKEVVAKMASFSSHSSSKSKKEVLGFFAGILESFQSIQRVLFRQVESQNQDAFTVLTQTGPGQTLKYGIDFINSSSPQTKRIKPEQSEWRPFFPIVEQEYAEGDLRTCKQSPESNDLSPFLNLSYEQNQKSGFAVCTQRESYRNDPSRIGEFPTFEEVFFNKVEEKLKMERVIFDQKKQLYLNLKEYLKSQMRLFGAVEEQLGG